MKGILIVDLPSSCSDCRYFNTILEKPLLLHFSDGSTEEVSGACACALDDIHRLKPMDNGAIMEQITRPNMGDGLAHTESYIHNGRPIWCPIKEKGVSFLESQNVIQGNSSQGVFDSSQREERSN